MIGRGMGEKGRDRKEGERSSYCKGVQERPWLIPEQVEEEDSLAKKRVWWVFLFMGWGRGEGGGLIITRGAGLQEA